MVDKLKDLIRERAQELIQNNSQIPQEKNEEAIDATSSSILEVLTDKVSAGSIKDILSSGQESAKSKLGGEIIENLTDKLAGLGIGQDSAREVATRLIPDLLSKIINSGKGGADINIQDLVAQVAGEHFHQAVSGEAVGNGESITKSFLNKAKDLFK